MKGPSNCARVRAIFLLSTLLSATAFAQATQVLSRGDLTADDFYDWGSDFIAGESLPGPNTPTLLTLTTDGGDMMDLDVPLGGPIVLVEAIIGNFGVDTWGGRFTAGDMVMNTAPFVTGDPGTVENITTFSNFTAAAGICGLGMQIQPFAGTAFTGGGPFDYTARIEGFAGGGSVGSFPVIGVSTNGVDGNAAFVGIRNASAFDSVDVSIISVTPLLGGVEIGDYAVNHITLEFCEDAPPQPGLSKTIVAGPNADTNPEIDVVIEAGSTTAATYSFELSYVGEDAVTILDQVAPQWDAVEGAADELNCTLASANGKDNGRSPTNVDCAATGTGKLIIDTIARCTGKKGKCQPKDCGAILLNEGAQAYDGDGLLVHESNSLCLAAVDGDLLAVNNDRDASADHDGDGIPSHAEACTAEVSTNPCLADSDGDGVDDDVDQCPLEGPPAVGEFNDSEGCNQPL